MNRATAMRYGTVLSVIAACGFCTVCSDNGLCPEGASREESQSCCPDLEIDACGAGLVCAALDGRKQPTCYREHSRVDLSECSDDLLCISGACSITTHKCQSVRLAICEEATGCAPDPQGLEFSCRADEGKFRCLQGPLAEGADCLDDAECVSRDCSCNLGGASRKCCQ